MSDTLPGFETTKFNLVCERCHYNYRRQMLANPRWNAFGLGGELVDLEQGCAYCGPNAVGKTWVRRDGLLQPSELTDKLFTESETTMVVERWRSDEYWGENTYQWNGEKSAWPPRHFHAVYRPALRHETAGRKAEERLAGHPVDPNAHGGPPTKQEAIAIINRDLKPPKPGDILSLPPPDRSGPVDVIAKIRELAQRVYEASGCRPTCVVLPISHGWDNITTEVGVLRVHVDVNSPWDGIVTGGSATAQCAICEYEKQREKFDPLRHGLDPYQCSKPACSCRGNWRHAEKQDVELPGHRCVSGCPEGCDGWQCHGYECDCARSDPRDTSQVAVIDEWYIPAKSETAELEVIPLGKVANIHAAVREMQRICQRVAEQYGVNPGLFKLDIVNQTARSEYIRRKFKERGPKVCGEGEVLPEHWREW